MYDSGGAGSTLYNDFEISMGICSEDTLGTIFANNYAPGTKKQVFFDDSLLVEVNPDGEITIPLDDTYYLPAGSNLLMEISWNGCQENGDPIYLWNWQTDHQRAVAGSYASAGATKFSTSVPWMILNGGQALQSVTWAEIKQLH
jgi:hypothetical protein